MTCLRRDELILDVQKALQKIAQTSEFAQEAIRRDDARALLQYDVDLESAIGESQRLFGALREHQREHGCGAGLLPLA